MTHWDISNVPSQKGRVALITGANSGIGFETALALAKKEAKVVLACRDIDKARQAKNKILQSLKQAEVAIMKLDLSSLADVEKFSKDFLDTYQRLDLLINNAGIMMSPYQLTTDGFENQLATNYLGHFALTGRLLPLLLQTEHSRVITLSSLSYKWSEIQFEDLHFDKGYSKRKAYGQSKRACLVFAYELERRLSKIESSTISVAAHPGLSKTNLDRYFPSLIRPLGALFLQQPQKGALPVLFAALHESLNGGEYIGPDGFQEMRGNPTLVSSDEYSKNIKVAERLWEVSEALTKVTFLSQNHSS